MTSYSPRTRSAEQSGVPHHHQVMVWGFGAADVTAVAAGPDRRWAPLARLRPFDAPRRARCVTGRRGGSAGQPPDGEPAGGTGPRAIPSAGHACSIPLPPPRRCQRPPRGRLQRGRRHPGSQRPAGNAHRARQPRRPHLPLDRDRRSGSRPRQPCPPHLRCRADRRERRLQLDGRLGRDRRRPPHRGRPLHDRDGLRPGAHGPGQLACRLPRRRVDRARRRHALAREGRRHADAPRPRGRRSGPAAPRHPLGRRWDRLRGRRVERSRGHRRGDHARRRAGSPWRPAATAATGP